MDNWTPSYAGEIQRWQGYWLQGNTIGDMQIEIFQSSDNRVYGHGCDLIGQFTWKGSFEGKQVLLVKKYLSQHALQYSGWRTLQETMEGEWTIGHHTRGRFYFERSPVLLNDPRVTAYLQEWQGYRLFEQQLGETTTDLVFTSKGTVYGGGRDDLGSFTILGNYARNDDLTYIGMLKHYDSRDAVNYQGVIWRKEASMVMDGIWIDEQGKHGKFSLTTRNAIPDIEVSTV